MAELNIQGSNWPEVEVGRVVLFNDEHKEAGKIATIVEIIDHKRVLVDGPSSEPGQAVPRQAIPLASCFISKIVIEKLPRGARNGTVKKFWEKAEVDAKWKASPWYKSRVRRERRRALTDFERYKVMRLKKQAMFKINKSFAKVRAAA